jgi:hypothetical protein
MPHRDFRHKVRRAQKAAREKQITVLEVIQEPRLAPWLILGWGQPIRKVKGAP